MANRKIQGEVTLDTSQAEQATARVEQSVKRMADSAEVQGKRAEKGVAAIGDGGEAAVQKIDRATSSFVTSIKKAMAEQERQLASMAAGAKNTSQYFESLANTRGIDVSKIDPALAKLRELESAVSVAAAAEKNLAASRAFEQKAAEAAQLNKATEYVRFWEESLRQADAAQKEFAAAQAFEAQHQAAAKLVRDAEYVRMWEAELRKADASQQELAATQLFEAQHAAATRLAKDTQYVRFWEDELEKAAAAEKKLASQNSFVKGLQDQAAAIGKTRAELLELKAAELGVSDQAAPFIARLKVAEGSLHDINVASKQAAWAMRLVPAQFTDIVTSLAAGQNPMMVFIQQGGQLKDMFGGVGNAARALGGYVVGLVNPMTIAGAATAAFAFAAYQGSKESQELAKSIILTGNAAGTSVDQLNDVARAVASATGATRGASAEALQQVVGSAQVTSKNLELVSEAAIRMERATGKAISETVKEFAELGKSPVEASLKLNEQYNYLTADIYRQIKALEDQGRTTEAIALAQKTFAEASDDMARRVEANLSGLDRAWRGLGDLVKFVADTMKSVARDQSLSEQIAALEQKASPGRGIFSGLSAEDQDRLTSLKSILAAQKEQTAEKEKQNSAEKAGIELFKERDKYISKEDEKQRALAKAGETYRLAIAGAAGDQKKMLDYAEAYEKAVAGIKDKFTDKKSDGTKNDYQQELQARLSFIKDASKQELDLIKERVKAGELTEIQGIEAIRDASMKSYQDQYEAQQRLLAATSDKGDRSKVIAEMQKSVVEWSAAEQKAVLDVAAVREKANIAAIKQQDEYLSKVYAETEALKEKAKSSEYENAAIGMTADQLAALTARRYDEQIALKQEKLAAIEMIETNAAEADSIREQIAALESLKRSEMVRPKLQEQARAWENFTRDIEQSLTDALMRSFEAGNSFGETFAKSLQNTFKTMILKVVVQAIVSPVMSGVGSVLGVSGAGSAGSSGGMLSLLSNGSSLFNGGSGITTSLGSAYGSAYGGASYALNPGAYAQGFGSGLFGSASQASSYWSAAGDAFFSGNDAAMAAYGNAATAAEAGSSAGSSAMSGLGYLGAIYSLSQGQYGAAAGAAIGTAIMPGIGTAIGSVLGSLVDGAFGSSSGPKAGYKVYFNYADDQFASSFRNGKLSKGSTGSEIDAYFGNYMKATDSGLEALGLTDKFTNRFNYTLNPQGKAKGTWSYGLWKDGFSFYEEGKSSKKDPQDALRQIDAAYSHMWESLLKSSLIPPEIKKVTDKMLDLGIAAKTVPQQLESFKSFLTSLEDINASADDAIVSIAKLVGGLDSLKTGVSSYYDNYFSQEEKTAKLTKLLSEQFAKLNIDMPATRAEFRDIVESLDLTTESGQEAFAKLIGLSGAFASLTDSLDEITRAALEAAKNLSTDRFKTREDYLYTKKTGIFPAYADGGWHDGGWAKVGEQGTELAYMPPSRIYSNADSKALIDTSGMRQEISNLRNDMRIVMAEFVRHSKKSAKVLDGWDTDGMPATRVLA